MKITVKELKNLVVSECMTYEEGTNPAAVCDPKTAGLGKVCPPGPSTTTTTSECGGMGSGSTKKGGGKVLLDEQPPPHQAGSGDALSDIQTVNQLLMAIKVKLHKIRDPRSLRTVMKVIDAVVGDLPAIRARDQKSTGFGAGVRAAIEKQRVRP